MTPSARISAAIECLDAVLSGAPAEKVMTTWARRNRYAGSGDRAAIRDLVFDALRRRRSYGWLGGGETGRALMIGALRAGGADVAAVFSGERFAPLPLNTEEAASGAPLDDAPVPVRSDCPDWLWPKMLESLGEQAEDVLSALRERAPVFLRVNLRKGDAGAATSALAKDDIEVVPHSLSPTALEVKTNPRRVQQSAAFKDGLVELQDVSSQAVVDRLLPFVAGKSVLDYCAGGGGKALAMAAGGAASVTAHDAFARRMADIPARAERAGTPITMAERPEGAFDLVFCDAPCSGSGAWRRQPDAKWRLTPDRLQELTALQDDILDKALAYVGPGGILSYATCSLLWDENEARAAGFLERNSGWEQIEFYRFSPLDRGDGFFLTLFQRTGIR